MEEHIFQPLDSFPNTHSKILSMKDIVSSALLETFVEVARSLSITEASKTLGRSQPAISQRIKQLEQTLEVELFQPAGRGIMLTRDGELLLNHAQSLLAGLRDLPRVLEMSASTPQGILRVGALPTMARYLMIDAIETIITKYPDVSLKVELGLETNLIAKLQEGWLDGVFFIGDMGASGLQSEHLGDVHMKVAAPPAMFETSPSLSQIAGQRLLLWKGPADPSFAMVERYARKHGLIHANTVEVPHIETLKALVERGLGYALLPDYVLWPELERKSIKSYGLPGFETTFAIHLHSYPERHQTLAMKVFSDEVTKNVRSSLHPIPKSLSKDTPR